MSGLLRKASLWAALVGLAFVIVMVRKTTAIEPMPTPPSPPAARPFAHGIAAAGLIEALRENTNLGVPTTGLVTHLFVKVWDHVEVGAPLLALDDRELQAQLKAQQADVRVRGAELAKAEHQAQRTTALRASHAVSRDEADTRDDEVAIARSQLVAARATVAQTQALIDRLLVRAPIAATVLQINTRVGEYATPAAVTAPLLLGSTDEVQVRADVDEQLAPRVRMGSRAVGYLKGDSQHPIAMTFVRIEPYVIPKRELTGSSAERVDTRVLQVIYRFPNDLSRRVYVGQQMDLFIEDTSAP